MINRSLVGGTVVNVNYLPSKVGVYETTIPATIFMGKPIPGYSTNIIASG